MVIHISYPWANLLCRLDCEHRGYDNRQISPVKWMVCYSSLVRKLHDRKCLWNPITYSMSAIVRCDKFAVMGAGNGSVFCGLPCNSLSAGTYFSVLLKSSKR